MSSLASGWDEARGVRCRGERPRPAADRVTSKTWQQRCSASALQHEQRCCPSTRCSRSWCPRLWRAARSAGTTAACGTRRCRRVVQMPGGNRA
eukprot:2447273-Prymnesium_polylepis.2